MIIYHAAATADKIGNVLDGARQSEEIYSTRDAAVAKTSLRPDSEPTMLRYTLGNRR